MKKNAVQYNVVTEIELATADLITAHQKMSFLVDLTKEQRDGFRTGEGLSDKTLRRMRANAATAASNPKLLPPQFDLAKFEQDVAMVTALVGFKTAAQKLERSIADTLLSVGKPTVARSDTVVGYVKLAQKNAVDGLPERRRRKARVNDAAAPATPVPAPADHPTQPPAVAVPVTVTPTEQAA